MGSTDDLLQLVKSVHQPIHINEYAGKTVAVDGRAWLLEGASTCALQLAENQDTNEYVDYFMRQLKLLQTNNVTPIVVFDGETLPCNKNAEAKRQRRMNIEKKKGLELLGKGRQEEALKRLKKAVDITPEMIQNVTKRLDKDKIQHVTAPFDASAQLTFLLATDKVQAVISNDRPLALLGYGCRTVIFQLDTKGTATRIHFDTLSSAKELNMSDWSAQKLQHFCMLSQGCDPNKKKMDVQRLHKLLSSAKNDDTEQQASPLVRAHFLQEVVDPVKQQRVSFHFMNNAIAVKVTERPTQLVKTELVSLSSENKENIPPWLQRGDQENDNSKSSGGPSSASFSSVRGTWVKSSAAAAENKCAAPAGKFSFASVKFHAAATENKRAAPPATSSLINPKKRKFADENTAPALKTKSLSPAKSAAATPQAPPRKRLGLSESLTNRVR